MDKLEELISVTVTDLLFDVDVEVVDVTFDVDRPCLVSIKLGYQYECVSSVNLDFSALFCTTLCYYNAAIFVDAVRETISKALMKGEK